MKSGVYQRAIDIGNYIASTGCTVRTAAKVFKISKSTVHKDVSSRLKYADRALYKRVHIVLERNKAERHMRGGEATKQKYMDMSSGIKHK